MCVQLPWTRVVMPRDCAQQQACALSRVMASHWPLKQQINASSLGCHEFHQPQCQHGRSLVNFQQTFSLVSRENKNGHVFKRAAGVHMNVSTLVGTSRRGSRILVRGASGVLTPRGCPSPTFAQNRGFPLKLPEIDFEEILGARGAPGPPGSATDILAQWV